MIDVMARAAPTRVDGRDVAALKQAISDVAGAATNGIRLDLRRLRDINADFHEIHETEQLPADRRAVTASRRRQADE
jgi:hypothetical protein